jgi:uncharacterized protein YutE (UPF0331/DUF86 family)
MELEENSADNCEKVLTSIHGMYTLSNTEESSNEVDRLAVKHFLNTLAEIALAIASRKSKEG